MRAWIWIVRSDRSHHQDLAALGGTIRVVGVLAGRMRAIPRTQERAAVRDTSEMAVTVGLEAAVVGFHSATARVSGRKPGLVSAAAMKACGSGQSGAAAWHVRVRVRECLRV